jgi:hypothetical protein
MCPANSLALADSGLATDQYDRWPLPRRVEDLQKALQLNLAPDECR